MSHLNAHSHPSGVRVKVPFKTPINANRSSASSNEPKIVQIEQRPTTACYAKLSVQNVIGMSNQLLSVGMTQLSIGRHQSNTFHIKSPEVSQVHFRIHTVRATMS